MTQPVSQNVAIDNLATFFVQGTLTDTTQGSISYQWQINGNNLSNGTVSLGSTVLTVSGANTQTLTISSNTVGINSIRAVLTHPVAGNSPFISDEVSFNSVEPRPIVKIEGYNEGSSSAVINEINLDDQEVVLTQEFNNFDWICLYASEKDIEIELDLYAAKGNDVGSFVGGEGGYSRIRLDMQKNDEYIISGIGANDSIFLYRKASLISVVGSGGDAGTSGNGGAGGGVNLSGSTAPNGGTGGLSIPEGSLTLSGSYGSIVPSTTTVYPGDSIEQSPNGGTSITCTKGIYWRDQGKSPCQDLGDIKFFLSNGTEVTNSATISRGFKAGYSITQTSGKKTVVGGGNGGSGATGGDGSTNNFGGGGGSGYSDGTIQVISSTIGGSNGNARVNVRLYDGGFYIDSSGRILILSCVDTRDPTTLTKTTGIVLPGSNSCIDDARWQNFLDLSRDGTKNYRLTGTTSAGIKVTTAANNNIHKMMNSNVVPLRTSLTNWYNISYPYDLRVLAWDETNPTGVYGSDYSLLSWSPSSSYGWGFYGESSNSFFDITIYNNFSVSYWILPPGVPDF